MNYKKLFLLVFASLMMVLFGCVAADKFSTFERHLLFEADSLFRDGNYELAKIKYMKIRDMKPAPSVAKKAQYYLGFINVYYENPFANWDAALREFKTFAELYPDDFRIDQVNSWIRILVVLQSFKKDYVGTVSRLEDVSKQRQTDSRLIQEHLQAQTKTALDSLSATLRNCNEYRDSLVRKAHDLENVILDLERKCQQAGR
jgi:outer membrane protein assembly factor BamD (BamD/ComL family)